MEVLATYYSLAVDFTSVLERGANLVGQFPISTRISRQVEERGTKRRLDRVTSYVMVSFTTFQSCNVLVGMTYQP